MKNLMIYLYTDDVKIVDLVFGMALKKNILESAEIEVIRKRPHDNLNSIRDYDLIIIDELINDLELSVALEANSSSIIRVIHNFDSLTKNHFPKVQDINFDKLRIHFGNYLS